MYVKLCVRLNYSNRKHIGGSQGQGDGVRRLNKKGPKETFGGDGNIPHFDCGLYPRAYICKTCNCTLKMGEFYKMSFIPH